MNMDLAEIPFGDEDNNAIDSRLIGGRNDGKYLIAVGQDQFCTLYVSSGYILVTTKEGETGSINGMLPSVAYTENCSLSLDITEIGRIVTESRSDNPYQICVRLFTRSSSSMDGAKRLLMATGGTDSCVRVWDVNALLEILAAEEEAEEQKRQQQNEQKAETSLTRATPTPLPSPSLSPLPPIFDMNPSLELTIGGGGDLLEIDASPCGQMLFAVGARDAVLWDSISGAKLGTLPQNCPPIDGSFKTRSIRFVKMNAYGKANATFFVAAHNPRQKTASKKKRRRCFLSAWSYNRDENNFHLISAREIRDELEVTNDSDSIRHELSKRGNDVRHVNLMLKPLVAIGTDDGSIGVYDIRKQLTQLYFVPNVHKLFVTALTFLPRKCSRFVAHQKNANSDGSGADTNQQKLLPPTGMPPEMISFPGVGITPEAQAMVASLSVDETVQLHKVPYHPERRSFTLSMLRIAFYMLLLYTVVWLLAEFLFSSDGTGSSPHQDLADSNSSTVIPISAFSETTPPPLKNDEGGHIQIQRDEM